MKIVILTEEAKTVADNAHDQELIQYYKGQFRPVTALVEELSEIAGTDVYILSDKYGLCRGQKSISEVDPVGPEEDAQDEARNALRESVPDSDCLIILLTKDAFEDVVEPIWDELVDSTRPNSIWGLGVPQSALDRIDIESLQSKSELYLYPRTGVARLGTETRERLLNAVRERKS